MENTWVLESTCLGIVIWHAASSFHLINTLTEVLWLVTHTLWSYKACGVGDYSNGSTGYTWT